MKADKDVLKSIVENTLENGTMSEKLLLVGYCRHLNFVERTVVSARLKGASHMQIAKQFPKFGNMLAVRETERSAVKQIVRIMEAEYKYNFA